MMLQLCMVLYLTVLNSNNMYFITCEETKTSGDGHGFGDLQDPNTLPGWDSNGYVFFCLCMGRFGNQVDHFLGGMAFAKALNRTLVIPPFRTYRNVRFTEWFQLDVLQSYHKAVLAEDFMAHYAASHWPVGKRLGFCWKPAQDEDTDCKMKDGNPFGPFWDGLGVDFDGSHVYRISYDQSQLPEWNKQYPPDQYPVLAFRGAPARFPVNANHRELQKYLEFSNFVKDQAQEYIDEHFKDQKYMGIHLRNGVDWQNACSRADNIPFYMASPQCLENTGKSVTKNLCYPSDQEVLSLTKQKVIETGSRAVFVATDKRPMIHELEEYLKQQHVKVYHADPHLPVIDLAILVNSEHFIGNCVSSFTAFVKRARDVAGKPSSFFGLT